MPQVRDRLGWYNLRRQQGRVGGDDMFVQRNTLQCQVGRAKSVVLVIHVAITRTERTFRHAPWQAEALAVADLALDSQRVGGVQDAAGAFVHHQGRHQVFEHRAGPGQQRCLHPDGRHRAAKTQPVFCGQVALGDGKEAGKTRLRCQKVITRAVHFLALWPIADGQQPLFGIHEQGEVHFERQAPRAFGKRRHALRKGCKAFAGAVDVANDLFAVCLQGLGPPDQFAGFGPGRLCIQIGGKAGDVRRDHDKVQCADRCQMRFGNVGAVTLREPFDQLFQSSAQRAQGASVIRHVVQGVFENCQCIADPLK